MDQGSRPINQTKSHRAPFPWSLAAWKCNHLEKGVPGLGGQGTGDSRPKRRRLVLRQSATPVTREKTGADQSLAVNCVSDNCPCCEQPSQTKKKNGEVFSPPKSEVPHIQPDRTVCRMSRPLFRGGCSVTFAPSFPDSFCAVLPRALLPAIVTPLIPFPGILLLQKGSLRP